MDIDTHLLSASDLSQPVAVSIIIPIGPGDESWRTLVEDLRELPFSAEIICVATAPLPSDLTDERAVTCGIRHWIVTQPGRAVQMNVAARQARGRHLWFLHADSRATPDALRALANLLMSDPHSVLYFNLTFVEGPWLMWLNAWGVWWRSHVCGMPFGDQGFCLEKAAFERLGGYSETARYGEDHLLVWMARRRGVHLKCTGQTLATSARKYREQGWFRTTVRYLWLTWRQAWPQFWMWLRGV